MSSPVVVGVDIGKEVFHLVGFAADGKIAFRMRIRRLGLKDAFEKLPPCVVAMGACLSAHSDSTPSFANGSRSIHEGREAPSEPGTKRLICSTNTSKHAARFSTFSIAGPADQQAGYDRTGNGLEKGEQLLDLYGPGVGDKDDVLVANRKLVGQQVGGGVGEVEPVGDRRFSIRCACRQW